MPSITIYDNITTVSAMSFVKNTPTKIAVPDGMRRKKTRIAEDSASLRGDSQSNSAMLSLAGEN